VARERADAGDTKSPPFDLTPHDMRRTGATRLAESGVPQADIAKVLNHAEGGPKATHVYVRYRFDKEKQVALETWARLLRGILDEKPIAPAVVPFVRR
jgi:integrase